MSFKLRVGVCALFLIPSLIGCASSSAGKVAAPSEAEMMAKWMAYATPGNGHEALAGKVGRWNLVVKMYTPGVPEPMQSTGTSEVRWIMDGRYLEDRTRGDTPFGPFEGLGYTAYDNLKQKYVATWADNLGTGIATGEGEYDAATKSFTYSSMGPDVVRGHWVAMRTTERWVDADHWVMEAYGPDYDGDEMLSMQIEYSRVR